jgi:hypothetical protein
MPSLLRHRFPLPGPIGRVSQVSRLGRLALLWFMLSIGVAIASPMVHRQAMELVCSAAGAVKAVVHNEDGSTQEMGATHMDCPLCTIAGAPPSAPAAIAPVFALPQGHTAQPIPAARLAAATAAPLPARGPPAVLQA